MKIVPPPSPPPRSANNLRLGIVRLGKAAGKIKYALLDECDISLVQQYAFEAKVVVDPNGMGAAVYAWAYDIKKGRHTGDYVHTLLWELHRGDIAPGCKVVHVNNVTVDNRLDNLALVPAGATDTPGHALCGNTSSAKGSDVIPPPARSLYWFAIAQLPVDPLEEQHYSNEVRLQQQQEQGVMGGVVRTCLNRNGEVLEVLEQDVLGGLDGPLGGLLLPGGGICYYECRYPPCTQMEQHLRQFSICGRCQEARYCGTTCQQRDWPVHKKTCQPKPRPTPSYSERSPER